jgi:VWFA-related protein
MLLENSRLLHAAITSFVVLFGSTAPSARAQSVQDGRSRTGDEVVRISSDLVQTDVTVLDAQGRFVEGLRPEQFSLIVDGTPRRILFFERVKAGTVNEEAQIAAARGGGREGERIGDVAPLDRGRLIFFFIDDLHILPANLPRLRESLQQFIAQTITQNDRVAIFTTSGQLGFLQQLINDKTILSLAVKRLQSRYFITTDNDRTPMTEFQAIAIERNDRGVLDYFVDQLLKEMNLVQPRTRGAGRGRANSGGGGQVAQADTIVRSRARGIVQQAAAVTKSTFASLRNVVQTAAPLSGRKLLFFISDGFFMDSQMAASHEELRKIADGAARSGMVVYSISSHGLITPVQDASTKVAFDPSNQLIDVNLRAITAAQEPLVALANFTGGRALLDTNDAFGAMNSAVRETSSYYLIAWRPEVDAWKGGKFHQVEVKIEQRPELMVRVNRGFFDEAETKDKPESKKSKKDPLQAELMAALKSLYPKRALPTSLSAGFIDSTTGGATLTATIEVDAQALGLSASGEGENAVVDLVGAVVNEGGKPVSEFEQDLTVTPLRTKSRRRVVYNHQVAVQPGIYQVRVAARDRKSGRSGSATQWLEVSDLKKGGFGLSSLFVGEMPEDPGQSGQLSICADRRFAKASRVGFLLYIYNATRNASTTDVALQVQVFRGDQPVVTRPIFKVDTSGMADLARVSYGEDFALNELPVGHYVLQVTAIDRLAKASATQRVNFIVE